MKSTFIEDVNIRMSTDERPLIDFTMTTDPPFESAVARAYIT